jgi:hypothetical protein
MKIQINAKRIFKFQNVNFPNMHAYMAIKYKEQWLITFALSVNRALVILKAKYTRQSRGNNFKLMMIT